MVVEVFLILSPHQRKALRSQREGSRLGTVMWAGLFNQSEDDNVDIGKES